MTTRVAEYKFTEEQMLEAVKGSLSIIKNVADRLDVDWHTAKTYIEKYDSVKKAFSDDSVKISDFAKNNISEAIKDGDIKVSQWFLEKYKNTSDDYSGKMQVEHTGEVDSNVTINIIGVNPE